MKRRRTKPSHYGPFFSFALAMPWNRLSLVRPRPLPANLPTCRQRPALGPVALALW
jgi:hypothetical protein